ncbi:acetyl-CoA C-acetyltransferase [Streptomyces sp. EN27]|uniref:acetyl-CoA C-acetyltransferase n=1 Tax=Streptomyces sp. EN27 TaxID=211464 RepID=UPI000AA953E1|nr:acetyl-CoA C-acetyltransferase [Streptomyces sp. EN27]
MAEAYIVEAVRTPVGRRGGGLGAVHPADLGAHVLRELIARSGVDPAAVEDVVFGCLDTVGPQAGDIARTSWLAAGLPEGVPGVTIDRQCGSSQQALHFAAQGVLSGTQDLVVAGGTQNMTQIPIAFASRQAAEPLGLTQGPYAGSDGRRARYGDAPVNQFHGAQLIAEKWGISRRAMEEFALTSHRRAVRALDEGRFARETVAYGNVTADEGPRRDTTLEKMAGLRPVVEGGTITAACWSPTGPPPCSSPPNGPSPTTASPPRARVHHLSVRGEDPIRMLSAPIPATAYALKKTGLTIDAIDLVEINEAFAPVVLAWLKETGADPERVNVNGGAIALGHPLGATGARLMTTLLHERERTGGRYGFQTMCEGGGQANVTIVERL